MTQRVLILAVGGALADAIWEKIARWSGARKPVQLNEWSPGDWPEEVRAEIESCAELLRSSAFELPVLYRSEHVDCWSMFDVFDGAMARVSEGEVLQAMWGNSELRAAWSEKTTKLVPRKRDHNETRWLLSHLSEAISAWRPLVERRLVILVRDVIGGLWMDKEVLASLETLPDWWQDPRSA